MVARPSPYCCAEEALASFKVRFRVRRALAPESVRLASRHRGSIARPGSEGCKCVDFPAARRATEMRRRELVNFSSTFTKSIAKLWGHLHRAVGGTSFVGVNERPHFSHFFAHPAKNVTTRSVRSRRIGRRETHGKDANDRRASPKKRFWKSGGGPARARGGTFD